MAAGKCLKKGSMNICRDKKGKFTRRPGGAKKKTSAKRGLPKPLAKYNCKTKPRMIKGRCRCTSKTGTKPFVLTKYCKRK